MGATIIQKKVWDQIPPNIQELILTASKEAEIELTEEIRKLDDKAVEVMSEYGLIAHKITDEEYAEWEAIVKTVYPYIRGRIVPEEAFDRVVRLRDDFRANRLSN
jgi:TRAP-type C4-dicarboxylate transport system substrate-binding protein